MEIIEMSSPFTGDTAVLCQENAAGIPIAVARIPYRLLTPEVDSIEEELGKVIDLVDGEALEDHIDEDIETL